ncbi:MAG: hypothetical protein GX558_10380, partial [Clostridiales bacterium]|nr:hypothetical protein [Clostridiales bacterium]
MRWIDQNGEARLCDAALLGGPLAPGARCGFAPVDWEADNPPKLQQTNGHLCVRMTADGALCELFAPAGAENTLSNRVDQDLFGCNFLKLDVLHLLSDGFADWALSGAPGPASYRADLADGLFPRVRFECEGLGGEILAISPADDERLSAAVLYQLRLTNNADRPLPGGVRLALALPPQMRAVDGRPDLYRLPTVYKGRPGYLAIACPGGRAEPGGFSFERTPAPGECARFTAAFGLSLSPEMALGDARRLAERSAEALRPAVARRMLGGFGELSIGRDEDMWWADFLRNYAVGGHAMLRTDPWGRMEGVVIGPQRGRSDTVNREDALRGLHWMPLFQPALCREWVLFVMAYLTPSERIPFDENLAANLGLLFAAGTYFQASGDAAFFERHPEVGASMEALLRRLAEVRADGPCLFRSYEVSDGHTLMDYDFCTQARLYRI